VKVYLPYRCISAFLCAGEVGVFEGHAFMVEAAISLGGNMRPGINVHRFANRIPLLFEGGSDVVTRTATKRIPWSNYRINHNTDKVGVFVSIVSTKIPFKGAGKEYIGEHANSHSHLWMKCT
jgi:DNA topoisomerase VI subunit B